MAEKLEPAGAFEAWVLVLDELAEQLALLRECAVDDSALLDLSNTPWLPPVGIGGLPGDLAPRASALTAEMESLRPVLHKRREETVRQLRAVESVPRESVLTSVYLDSVG